MELNKVEEKNIAKSNPEIADKIKEIMEEAFIPTEDYPIVGN